MKKIKIIIALCLILSIGESQNYYGEYAYSHSDIIVSSGNTTTLTADTGFVIGSYVPVWTVGNGSNFNITRTEIAGQIATSYTFSNDYSINYNASLSCGGTANQIAAYCYGISVIETAPTATYPTVRFMAVGAFEYGLFIAALDNTGAVVNQKVYYFTLVSPPFTVSKPLIVEDPGNLGEYFVVGCAHKMYGLRVDQSCGLAAGGGGPSFRNYYTIKAIPKAILFDPNVGGGEVVVVGESDDSVYPDRDGFFVRINSSGLPGNIKFYDNNNGQQGFCSVDIANSPNYGGNGYVIGGYDSSAINTNGAAWMLKTDNNGSLSGTQWSNVIQLSGDPMAGPVVGIVERYNTGGTYEYYGAVESPSGLFVIKLDDSGTPVTNGEFQYSIGTNAKAVALTMIDQGPTSPDLGLHLYATDNAQQNPSNIYFAESCFSGNSGCSAVTNVSQYNLLTPMVTPSTQVTTVFTNACSGVISPTIFAVSINACSGSAPFTASGTGGNNNRITATFLKEQETAQKDWMVFPNPTSSKIYLDFKTSIVGKSKISIFDFAGVLLNEIKLDGELTNGNIEIDFELMNIESGIYLIKLSNNEISSVQKVIYNKE